MKSEGLLEIRVSTEIGESTEIPRIYWNLDLLKSRSVTEIWESIEIRGSTEISKGLLNLEKSDGLLKSWRSIEIWESTETTRVFTEIQTIYWDLKRKLRSRGSIEIPSESFLSIITAQFWARCARLKAFSPKQTPFFSGALRASDPACLRAKWTFSSPCPK